MTSPPPPADADVEAIVRRLHDEHCQCDRPPYLCNVSGKVIRAAVQAGRDSMGGEVEPVAALRRLLNDTLAAHGAALAEVERLRAEVVNERDRALKEANQLRERVAELEQQDKNVAILLDEALNQMTVRKARIASLEAQLAEANHRCGAAWRDLADARKRIDDLDKHVLFQRGLHVALPDLVAALEAAERDLAYTSFEDTRGVVRAALAKVRP